MKKTCIVVIVLLALLNQCLSVSIPNQTPTDWTENGQTAACQYIGVSKIVQDSRTIIPLTSQYFYYKSNYVYVKNVVDSNLVKYQQFFKYYIRIQNNGGVQTYLQISYLPKGDPQKKITQTVLISNQYKIIDCAGPLCLLKQTDNQGNLILVIYYHDMIVGNSNLTPIWSFDFQTFSNEIFNQMQITDISGDALYYDPNYSNSVLLLRSTNALTSETIIRRINANLIVEQIYRFKMQNSNSDIYTNLILSLEISGSNFYTYVSPPRNSGSIPFIYANDQTAISTSSGIFSNHIVITFMMSMMITTYDNNRQNGNLFFLVSDSATYALSLVNMKTTLNEEKGSLQYLSDQISYIIELNLNPTVSTFYIVWADDLDMNNFTFLNSLGDNKNSQIIEDFSNQQKISSFVLGQQTSTSYSSSLYLWIYSSTKIVKYIFQVAEDASHTILSIDINKDFSVELAQNLLVNQIGFNFQVTTLLKCVCQATQITSMICFYGTDACTFTVQTLSIYCNPING